MAVTVDYIYQQALKIIRKNQAGGLSSVDFQYHWNGEQNAYFTDLLGHFNRASNGKSGINTGLIENQTILTKLTPFIKPVTITITSGDGDKPGDFIYELGLRINGKKVTHINHGQISDVEDSVIDTPSEDDDCYYCVEYEDYYRFLPDTVTEAELDYISAPVNVVWAYGFDVDNRQVYTSVGSVQPQWLNNDASEITKRMLKTLGVAFSSQDFQNFGNSVINTGD